MERRKQIKCVVDDNRDSVDNSDDSANKHLTHLSQADNCCLMERSKQIECVDGNKDNGIDDSDDNSDDSGDKHLTHLTQVENN
eukprot:7256546-Ditylum_brightwellii.AAC.1